ncbi:unnamed protein product, partial [Allacma fusca]
MQRSNG